MPQPQGAAADTRGPKNLYSGWSLAILLAITYLVTSTDIDRFKDPVGEKTVQLMAPGNADFFFPFGGARALLMGENPYLNDMPGLDDPWFRGFGRIDGKQYRGIYPPTHFLLYLPLALVTDDWREAGRILFGVNVAALFVLSVVTWQLVVRSGDLTGSARQASILLVPLCFFILTLNAGTSLGLERGDGGDILASTLCWAAILLFLKRRRVLSMFLLVPATLLKGYPILFALGLVLLDLDQPGWKRTVAGLVAGITVFLLPVARYLPEAVTVLANNKGTVNRFLWWNHGFRNVFLGLMPGQADRIRWILVAGTGLIALACWLRARQALRQQDSPGAALWIAMFATCSIEVMLGLSATSLVYNLVLIQPGILILFLLIERFVRSCGLPGGTVHAVGASLFLAAAALFKFKWGPETVSWAGIGMILLLATIGATMAAGWWHARRNSPSPGFGPSPAS